MIKQSGFLLLLCIIALGKSSGVTEWCTHSNTFLDTYCSGTFIYPDLETAKAACLLRSDCFGITRQGGSRYTLRKGWKLTESSGDVSYVPCSGYFKCSTFGLKSVYGKFLSAQSDGTVEWNRDSYGAWEQITFEQWGKDSGFLKSIHGKYLAAAYNHELEWDRPHKLDYEKFTVYQYEDKIALQSAHGRYMSAQPDGSVDVDRTEIGRLEWFQVHPQDCLNNIQCDCDRSINTDDYEMSGVEYHQVQGSVYALPPEQVGFQHIDNKDSTSVQSTTFSVSEEVTETSSFTHTAGASVTVGTTFEAGVPLVAKGEISTEVSASYEYSAGTEKSVTKTLQADYNCVAKPGKRVTCETFLFKYLVSVPYTQTWQHKRLPCTCTSEGEFTETSGQDMRLLLKEE